ncbi:hypothetical protein ACFVIM_16365 [Streptomyces sp. NPDC057638]|uniref:hypothetical protein n=1 Tax=Streptomyces sp. NPDC057638 TaxID=3346190 RepID=UPI0036B59001
MRRLWVWLTLALGAAEDRLGLGFELLRLRWDAECVDEWSRDLVAEARQARQETEWERLLRPASEEGGPW